jgi:ATP-dependent DNA helicase HFM1/MER3
MFGRNLGQTLTNFTLIYTSTARNASTDEHTYQDTLGVDMRIVCVSATLPNIDDIASFIDANEAHNFDPSYRPVPLTTHVVGLGYMGKNAFMFDQNLGKEVPGLLHRFSGGKPSIVFCHTKKQTEALALELVSTFGSQTRETVQVAKQTNLSSLKKCLERGIAFHHAGMEAGNRHLVEKAFSRGLVKCLCATSTLAMGINLPVHLVIIKGTQVWRGAGQGYTDIDKGTLLQMMGRAGRPGFDTSGTAVIMTDKKSKPFYEHMSTGLEVVESKLLKNLVEILNTEISQNVIGSLDEAIDWMKGTFFYTRVKKNSPHYGLLAKSEQEREGYLMKKCLESLKNLHSSNIITVANNGMHTAPKKASHVMSRHLVPFHTMQLIMEIPHDPGPLHILRMLSEMEGLHFPVRKAEKVCNQQGFTFFYELFQPIFLYILFYSLN